MTLPQDPFILLSYVNTQLRDNFSSLEALCDDAGVPVAEGATKLEPAVFHFDPLLPKFRKQRAAVDFAPAALCFSSFGIK